MNENKTDLTRIKVLIKTPKGFAKKTEFQLRPFLIGNKGKLHDILTNEDDNKILWIVDAKPNQYSKIIRNVSFYKFAVEKILSNKSVQKIAKLSDDQKQELKAMLDEQTEIDIVKASDWEKIKKEFKTFKF